MYIVGNFKTGIPPKYNCKDAVKTRKMLSLDIEFANIIVSVFLVFDI